MDFNDSDDEEEDSEEEEDIAVDTETVQDSENEEGGPIGAGRAATEVTPDLVKETISAAIKGSYSALKRLMTMFRSACIPANAEDSSQRAAASRYTVSTPEIYNAVMVKTMENAYKAFYHQLDLKRGKITSEQLKSLDEDPRLKKVQPLILSFYKSLVHSLDSLATTDQAREVVLYLVSGLEPYIPLLAPVPRLAKSVLRVLLKLWSTGPSPVEDPTHARGHCFLRIRQLCIVLPGVMPEECFKSIYMTFARSCKTYSELTEPSIVFMVQCITELYKLDPVLAYQQGFLYIRQLALHLRAAYVKKTTETTRAVLNWQYLNCLRLWTRVVCSMPGPEELGPLVFPLAQVMQGVLSVAVSVVYLPLRFHVISSLQQLAANAGVFIPLAPKLREIFELNEILSKPKPSTDVAPKFQYLVKLPADECLKPAVRDCIIDEAIYLLRQEAEIYRFHVAVPEYLYLTTRKMRNFCKNCKIVKWRDLGKTLITRNEDISAFAKKERLLLGKAPMDITDFEPIKPAKEARSAHRLGKLLAGRASGLTAADEILIGTEQAATREVETPSAASWRSASIKANAPPKDSDDDTQDDDMDSVVEEPAPALKGKKRKVEAEGLQRSGKKGKAGKKATRYDDDALSEDEVEGFVWSDGD